MNTKVKAYWLGHSAFKLISPQGRNILIDPFLSQNPSTPEEFKNQDEADYILLTHGHEDHVGDTLQIADKTKATVVGIVELMGLLKQDGLAAEQAVEFNKGGTVEFDEFSVTMTSANHSSSFGGRYAGDPAGLVVSFKDDITLYHMGDTNIFMDLQLYADLYKPDVAFVPMGDHFTMGPGEAARAVEMLNPSHAVPIHYATFPPLVDDPKEFKQLTEAKTSTKVITPEAGDEFLSNL